ncbi:MAG: hypothetical protein KBA51_03600 [Kiritimatiellae bacterium]|nr:hypothetical protein [Kiritimatiellia bacterium]
MRRTAYALTAMIFMASAAIGFHGGDRLRYPDERSYDALARSIMSGGGYSTPDGRPTAFRPPGWPMIMAGVYQLWPHPVAAKVFNAAAYAGAAALLSVLAARIHPSARPLVPLLMLGYPLGLYSASTLYPQTFGTLLLAAILVLLWNRGGGIWHGIFAGILLGALILTIPSFMLVVPLILAGAACAGPVRWRILLRQLLWVLVCAAAVLAPWMYRNERIFRRFVPVSTNGGLNLLLGNSEHARPNSGVNVNISAHLEGTEAMNEAERDEHLRRCALAWAAGNPGAWFKLYARKVLNHFHYRNELYVQGEQTRFRNAVVMATYYPLIALAAAGIIFHRRHPLSPTEIALHVLYFGNAFVAAIVFTRIRFRVPFDALLMVLVAAGVARLREARILSAHAMSHAVATAR